MHTTAYLFFNGNCLEALSFYEKALGAKIQYVSTYGASPAASHCPPEMHDKVINANFLIGETQLMASDSPPQMWEAGGGRHGGFAICVNTFSDEEAEKVFAGLSEGGKVTMALGPTFFAHRFGQLDDRFGISWMVIFEKKPK